MIHEKIDLWANADRPPASDGQAPSLEAYLVDGDSPRGAVAICPGGGYHFLSPREAEPIALQFAAAGYHAFVIRYSIAPRRHPLPVEDAARAVALIRSKAASWKVRPDRVALCGFSAGGHLAASLGTRGPRSARPDALILCYPVISSGAFAHRGSFENLLGPGPGAALLAEVSPELHVDGDTPPTFIWHTADDQVVPVENSLLFAAALRAANRPFESHIYPRGPHGLSLATAETDDGSMGARPHVATWMGLCLGWLGELWA